MKRQVFTDMLLVRIAEGYPLADRRYITRVLLSLLLVAGDIGLFNLQAQQPAIPIILQAGKTLGKSEYFVDYIYKYKPTPQDKDFNEDIIRLELGTSIVKSYSYRLWQADSALTHAANKSAPMRTPSGDLSPFWYYRNLTSGRTQVWYRTPLAGPILRYMDTPSFSWLITGRKKIISGYETQLATCLFRGRSYEAWFAPSIPISAGPNLFGGLPGLILELRSTDGEHYFTLDALQKRSTDIVEWKIRLVKEVSRPQFRDYCQRLHKHPMQTFKSNGQRVYPQNEQGDFLSEAEALDWQIPYNPIELE